VLEVRKENGRGNIWPEKGEPSNLCEVQGRVQKEIADIMKGGGEKAN